MNFKHLAKQGWDKFKSNKIIFYSTIGGIGVAAVSTSVAIPIVLGKTESDKSFADKETIVETTSDEKIAVTTEEEKAQLQNDSAYIGIFSEYMLASRGEISAFTHRSKILATEAINYYAEPKIVGENVTIETVSWIPNKEEGAIDLVLKLSKGKAERNVNIRYDGFINAKSDKWEMANLKEKIRNSYKDIKKQITDLRIKYSGEKYIVDQILELLFKEFENYEAIIDESTHEQLKSLNITRWVKFFEELRDTAIEKIEIYTKWLGGIGWLSENLEKSISYNVNVDNFDGYSIIDNLLVESSNKNDLLSKEWKNLLDQFKMRFPSWDFSAKILSSKAMSNKELHIQLRVERGGFWKEFELRFVTI